MKIILDESVPQKLRLLIDGHTVVTTWFQGWSGLKNGALLTASEEAGFDLFITADQELTCQQKPSAPKNGGTGAAYEQLGLGQSGCRRNHNCDWRGDVGQL